MNVFDSADNDDRAGKASKKTGLQFLAASQFLELLKVFGEIDSELEEKIKYAKFKAVDILKAFKEGRIPASGSQRKNIEPSYVDGPSTSVLSSPNQNQSMIETTQKFSEMSTFVSNQQFQPQQFFQPVEQSLFEQNDLQSLNTSSPSFQPLQNTNLNFEVSSHQYPSFKAQPHQNQSFLIQPQLQQTFSSSHSHVHQVVQSPQQFINIASTQISPFEMDHKSITDAQKFARFAISALQYEDVPTAIENLKKGLSLLEKMQAQQFTHQNSQF
ncbi:hypothetical protein HK096_009393 [Nowakowskiella sp. JEL0078]|nr:hypothetical protein HK096_009393 [Nowakowskiella sp. JEL0078]